MRRISALALREKIVKTILSAFILLTSFVVCAEEVRYVTDVFEVTMRTGQGSSNKILKNLRSGTKIEVIEDDLEAGYTLVRTADEKEGWVLRRYLVKEPIARLRIASFEKKNERLTAKIKELRASLSTVQQQAESLDKENRQLNKTRKKLTSEVTNIKEISADQIGLFNENKTLKEQLLTIKRDVQELDQENIKLQDQSARNWFLIGGGVLVLGVVLGLILPNVRFRKKSNWGRL